MWGKTSRFFWYEYVCSFCYLNECARNDSYFVMFMPSKYSMFLKNRPIARVPFHIIRLVSWNVFESNWPIRICMLFMCGVMHSIHILSVFKIFEISDLQGLMVIEYSYCVWSLIWLGESVDISDAILLNSELLSIYRLYIGMSYIIRISEHSRNVFRVSLGFFFLL